MKEIIFNFDGLVVFKKIDRFYLRYDAGAHQVAIREDEISEEDVHRVTASPGEASKVLFELQRRLTDSGINLYVSNVKQDREIE